MGGFLRASATIAGPMDCAGDFRECGCDSYSVLSARLETPINHWGRISSGAQDADTLVKKNGHQEFYHPTDWHNR
jgi:hypothetical protein